MHFSSIISVALLAVSLPLFTTAEHHGPSRRHHNELANRKRTAAELMQWHKRETNARATFYDVGLGACGKNNVPSDFIVALNSCEFGGGYPGPHCFEMITITYQGKSTQAQITDECPGCPCGGLDMSRGLFTFFASEGTGVIYVDWSYNDGSGGGDAPAPDPPAPTTSKKPTPTSTWTPPATTTSSKWVDPSPSTSEDKGETTSSTKAKTSSSSSSSSSSYSSSTSSSSSSTSSSISHNTSSTSSTLSAYATPAPESVGATPNTPQNLQGLNSLVAMLGKFVVQYSA